MRYVIIGGSIAGIAAAKSIRAKDAGAAIIMISKEKGKTYYRPMIPYLIEKSDVDIAFLKDPVEQYTIRMIYDLAISIDAEKRAVTLESGNIVQFDRLLIATGGKAVIPDIRGIEGPGSFTLRTRNDADHIREFAAGKKNAVIIGAGMVGIRAATALKNAGLNVTLIEQLDQILSGKLDRRGAEIIMKIMKDTGFSIVTNDIVTTVVRKGDAITGVTLRSGKNIDAEIVIVATGVEPDISFLSGSGIETNRGILINERLETNIPDIFAAGDVVEYIDAVKGKTEICGLWTNAEEMGRFAGINMAGGSIAYRGYLSTMNSTEIQGIPIISVGIIDPEEGEYEIISDDRIDSYRKLVFKGDVLVGFVFLGDIRGAGIYTGLVRNGIAIRELKTEAIRGSLEYIDFLRPPGMPTMTT
jgi:NAD(P)H-nitrite reductase large subunit